MIDVHIAEELPALPSVSAIGVLMSHPIYRQDETENNIIGKILSLEMMNYKIQEHFENIATQISLS